MAGSADIRGKQHYIAGIGHPASEPSTEASPAMVITNPLTGGKDLKLGDDLVSVAIPKTFAQLLAALSAGYVGTAFVTDVGNGSMWVSDGTRVRALNGEVVVYKNTSVVNLSTATPRSIGLELPLPAGFWKDGDVLEVSIDLYKSGTIDASTTQIQIGNTGVVGTQLGNVSMVMSSGGNRRAFGTFRFKRNSATSVTLLNGPNGQDGIAASSDRSVTTATVLDMDAATRYLQITNAMATGGTDVVTIDAAIVRLITA